MIIEKIPALKELSPDEKIVLAEELWAESGFPEEVVETPQDHARVVGERWEHYLSNPESAHSWNVVKKRIRGRDS